MRTFGRTAKALGIFGFLAFAAAYLVIQLVIGVVRCVG